MFSSAKLKILLLVALAEPIARNLLLLVVSVTVQDDVSVYQTTSKKYEKDQALILLIDRPRLGDKKRLRAFVTRLEILREALIAVLA